MNEPKTITTAPAGVIPAARTAQNITVEQRATMNSSRRNGQVAAAPSQPATPRAAATPPATAAAPSEGQPAAQPGTEPNSIAAAATPATAAAPVALTPADALANAAPAQSPAPASSPGGEDTGEGGPQAGNASQAAEPHLNGEAPDWLQPLIAGDNSVVPVAVKQMAKRIGELTYRLRTAETALAAGAGEVPAPAPDAVDPVAPSRDSTHPDVQTNGAPAPAPAAEFQKLTAQVENEWKIIEWCQKNRDGGIVTGKGGVSNEFTAEQVAEQLVASQRKVQDLERTQARLEEQHRAQFTQNFARSKTEAERKYPWMADPKMATPEAREAKAYIDANLHVLQDPQWPLVVGRYVTGLLAERKAPNGSATPPVAPPLQRPRATGGPAPVPGAPPSQAPRVNPLQNELARLNEEFRKTGSVKIKQKIFALQRQMPAGVAA